jgi:hypothetical protein
MTVFLHSEPALPLARDERAIRFYETWLVCYNTETAETGCQAATASAIIGIPGYPEKRRSPNSYSELASARLTGDWHRAPSINIFVTKLNGYFAYPFDFLMEFAVYMRNMISHEITLDQKGYFSTMRITRRRQRRADPFISPEWVRLIFDQLKAAFPLLATLKEKDLIKLARAVRHVERYSATDTRRGRPSRWPREDLVRVGLTFTDLLRRETSGRMSLATFVDHYLRILDFPVDVLEALSSGAVNLFEAEQLARITAQRLQIGATEAKKKRAEMLKAHLQTRASGERLRRRVNEMLNPNQEATSPSQAGAHMETIEDLEDFDPHDSTHLFWEEIKQLGFAFRALRREDLTDELIEELLEASQSVWSVLAKIQRRKQATASQKLII